MSEAAATATSSSPSEEKFEDIRDSVVREKYSKAAEIVNSALTQLISQCKPGAKLLELCINSDKYILEQTSKVYKNDKKLEKGIAFPTCISINNVVGHYCPLNSDANAQTLKAGDLAKLDLGCHIDGYISVAAQTIVIQTENTADNKPLTGKGADLLAAVHTAVDAAQRLVRVGNTNTQVTEIINKVAAEFKVNPVIGVLSHQLKRFVIDGSKVIINKSDAENKVEEFTFAPNEVYAIDVVFSTGEGKPKEIDNLTTVYKRVTSTTYQLKMQVSRAVLSDINQKFPTFPFTIRDLESEAKAKMAIRECVQHNLVTSYPVLHEKEGEFVAQCKVTFLVTDKGTVKITGLQLDNKSIHTEHKVQDEEIRKILNSSTSIGATGANKKKKKPTAKKEGGDAKPDDKPATTTTDAPK